ncbi:glycosyltransferase [Vibrio neonatus]|uniref:glycosyltransferase n=1 Tax=Vibrio neonatus TaxID=278860 RepID=UPI0039EFAA25
MLKALPYIYTVDYSDNQKFQKKLESYKDYFKFISVTYNYPHKNLGVISKVAELLELKGINAIFIVTFPKDEYDKQSLTFKKYTVNMGPVSVEDCKSLYKNADALFLPTLIECFSVSYLEAMANNLCIATSDYDFARDICGDCAIYFDPFSPQDISNKLSIIIENEDVRRKMLIKGGKRIKRFPDNKQKVKSYLKIINDIIGQ